MNRIRKGFLAKYVQVLLWLSPFMLFIPGSCYYDKADQIYPVASTGTCDTTNVSYSGTVVPILSANCYNCHSGTASSGGGIVLSTYNGLLIYVKSGSLLNDIEQNPGANPMPKGGGKLDNCSISKITAWIKKGMPNN